MFRYATKRRFGEGTANDEKTRVKSVQEHTQSVQNWSVQPPSTPDPGRYLRHYAKVVVTAGCRTDVQKQGNEYFRMKASGDVAYSAHRWPRISKRNFLLALSLLHL